jgi:hypothetical protein
MTTEISYLTILASFQHVRVYGKGADEADRYVVKTDLVKALEEFSQHYSSAGMSDRGHVLNIGRLADRMTERCGSLLYENRFRIGVAQKALNLYLKYLWCIDLIPEPPNCPFDRTIIQELDGCHGINWSQFDDMATYDLLVTAARIRAGGQTLAEWELRFFNEA